MSSASGPPRVIRAIGVLCALALTSLSAACGSGSGDTAAASNSPGEKTWNVAFVTPRAFNAFHMDLACNVEGLAKDAGLNLKFYEIPSGNDYNVQYFTQTWQRVMANKPDAVFTDVADAKADNARVKQMTDAGIKTIVYDSINTDSSVTSGQVTLDLHALGAMAADKINEATGGKAHVLIIAVSAGEPTTNARAKGFTDQAVKYPGLKVLPLEYDDLSATKDQQIIQTALAKYPDLALFFTYNLAAINSMPAVIDSGRAGQVKVASNDTDAKLVDWLKKGYIEALYPNDAPGMAKEMVNRALTALKGGEVTPRLLLMPPHEVNQKNVNDPATQPLLYKGKC
jgi:ribose transport system substrate-binding protein